MANNVDRLSRNIHRIVERADIQIPPAPQFPVEAVTGAVPNRMAAVARFNADLKRWRNDRWSVDAPFVTEAELSRSITKVSDDQALLTTRLEVALQDATDLEARVTVLETSVTNIDARVTILESEIGTAVPHTILDAVVHTDSVTQTVTRGALIYGNATLKWDLLTIGPPGTYTRSDGTDVAWSSVVATEITGILPVSSGGTNTGSWTAGSVIFAGAGGTSLAEDNSNLFWDDTNNRLGIGMNAPIFPLHVGAGLTTTANDLVFFTDTRTAQGPLEFILDLRMDANPTSYSSLSNYGGLEVNCDSKAANTVGMGTLVGCNFKANHRGTGTADNVFGVKGAATNIGAGTVTEARGISSRIRSLNAAGTIVNAYNYFIETPSLTGPITNQYGLYLNNMGGAGATSVYGIYNVGQSGASTNNFFIYSVSGTSYFGGSIGMGTTTPQTVLSFASASTGISLYNTADQVTNYERGIIAWSGSRLEIGTQKGGTGSNRIVNFLSPAGQFNFGRTSGTAGRFEMNVETALTGDNLNLIHFRPSAAVTAGGWGTAWATSGFYWPTSGGPASYSWFGVYPQVAVSGTYSATDFSVLRISPELSGIVGITSVYLINAGTNSGTANQGTHTRLFSVNNSGSTQMAGGLVVGSILTAAVGGTYYGFLNDASTATASTMATINHGSTGTPAAGFGTDLLYLLESDSTANQDAGALRVAWTTVTNANRTAAMYFRLVNNAASIATSMVLSAAGGLSVGSGTLDALPVGVINAVTGFRANNAAPSGQFLRGDGTNFVASAILLADLPAGSGVTFDNPSALVSTAAVNGVATTAMRSDAAPAIDQGMGPTWTGGHTWDLGTGAPADDPFSAISLDIPALAVAGVRDSHAIFMRGRSFDASPHAPAWRQWVNVTSNAGASSWTLQGNLDAGAYTTRLRVYSTGVVEVGPDAVGTTVNNILGQQLLNATPATVALNQNSPSFMQQANGWLTNAGGSSDTVKFRQHVAPVTGTSAATGYLRIDSSIGGNSYGNPFVLYSSGGASLGSVLADQTFGVLSVQVGFRIAGGATSGTFLRGNGTNFVQASLSTADIGSGVLPIVRGGTNASSFTDDGIVYYDAATTAFKNRVSATQYLEYTSESFLTVRRDVSGTGTLLDLNNQNTDASSAIAILGTLAGTDLATNVAGVITFKKEQSWTSTASTRDGAVDINTLLDNNNVTALSMRSSGSIICGKDSTLLSRTDDFLYACPVAGAPTGVPTAFSNRIAIAPDTTNKAICYYAGAWIAHSRRSLTSSTTQQGNTALTETDLFTTSVAAATGNVDGASIDLISSGTFATSLSADKRVRAYWAGVLIFDSGNLNITTTQDWALYVTVIRVDATNFKSIATLNTSSASLSAYADYASGASTWANANTLKVTGQGTNASDVVGEFFKVNFEM